MVVLVGGWYLPTEVSVADAVAISFEGNDFGMVHESVDGYQRHGLVGENPAQSHLPHQEKTEWCS